MASDASSIVDAKIGTNTVKDASNTQTIVFDLKDTEQPSSEKLSTETSPDQPGTSQEGKSLSKKPTCIIVLGMAGSGKTTFVQRLVSHLHAKGADKKRFPYVVNLDPACLEVSYA